MGMFAETLQRTGFSAPLDASELPGHLFVQHVDKTLQFPAGSPRGRVSTQGASAAQTMQQALK